MSNTYNPITAIKVIDMADYDIKPLSTQQYAELEAADTHSLMLESPTLEEVEISYIGSHLTDDVGTAMFEAITTTKMRLSQTMRAFVRVLNRGLNGTGITAGTNEAGLDDAGGAALGGAQLGNVRKIAGVPVMTAKIPCTDGQSISIIFHSPSSDGIKLQSTDILVAFKFLLNKRDVTHIVAPIAGRDLSLNQTAQTLSNLIERNSAKFAKAQEGHGKLRANLESAENEAEQLEAKAAQEMAKADGLLEQQKSLGAELDSSSSALARVQKKNNELALQIAKLKKKVQQVDAVNSSQSGSVQGSVATEGEDSVGDGPTNHILYYYGMKARPNWRPRGAVEVIPAQEASELAIIKAKLPHISTYRYGVAVYEKPLSESAIEDYELVDMQSLETGETALQKLALLNPIIANYKAQNPDATEFEFLRDFLKYNAPRASELPKEFHEARGLSLMRTAANYQRTTTQSVAETLFQSVPPAAETIQEQVEDKPSAPAPAEEIIPTNQDESTELPPLPETAPIIAEPEPEPEQAPFQEPELKEADVAAQQGIDYLTGLLEYQSNDPAALDAELAKVESIAGILTNAGKLDENEELLNRVADHLVSLSVAVAQGGVK